MESYLLIGIGSRQRVIQGESCSGVKENLLEVEACDSGKFFVSIGVRNKVANFRWKMVVVYGPTNHDFSHIFLEELDRKCKRTTLPFIWGGDSI